MRTTRLPGQQRYRSWMPPRLSSWRRPELAGPALCGELGLPVVPGNRLTMVHDGPQTYQAMLGAIATARQSIHLETYIFADNPVGWAFAYALAERAHAGVAVKVLYDAVGSSGTRPRLWTFLRAAKIDVRGFHPFSDGLLKAWSRDHRKLLIVDGVLAYIGGQNIGDGCEDGMPRIPTRRDLHAQIQGPVVAALQDLFFESWREAGGEPAGPRDPAYYPPLGVLGTSSIVPVGSGAQRTMRSLYLRLLRRARRHVLLASAYFCPDAELLLALKQAVARGVKVQLLLPAQSDIGVMVFAARRSYEDLLAAGVEVYEYQSRILHMKLALVDGTWALLGSSNLDARSLDINYEADIVILDRRIIRQLARRLRWDIWRSRRITLATWQTRPALQRLREYCVGLLHSLL